MTRTNDTKRWHVKSDTKKWRVKMILKMTGKNDMKIWHEKMKQKNDAKKWHEKMIRKNDTKKWHEKMIAFIILREAFSKNNNIWVIKSLKLMSFKYENDWRDNLSYKIDI